jgi:crossover junction endodeoxyribonuclease RusA
VPETPQQFNQATTMPNNTISHEKITSANAASVSLMIELPWPSRALSPNTRQHWSALSKAKKAYRTRCKQLAEAKGAAPAENASAAVLVDLTFFPPDRRARDLDNLLASMKSGLDGLADAIGVDDSKWSLKISKSQEVVKGGVVLVNLEISHV